MSAILIHVNYFEQGQSLERACRLTREVGADGIEFRRKAGDFSATDLEYLDVVSAALDKHPFEWVSFGAPAVELMGTDKSQHEREIEAAEKFYRKAASRFPLRVVNAFTGTLANPDETLPYVEYWHHGSAIATEEQWEAAIAGFQHLGALAGELGFRFAFETHGTYLHDTIEASNRLVDGIGSPHVGILWDHANFMLFQTSPTLAEAVASMGNRLFYVHLKNLLAPPAKLLAVTSLSGGILNIREQISLLRRSGYAGPLCIESPRAGDRELFLREDINYLREILREA